MGFAVCLEVSRLHTPARPLALDVTNIIGVSVVVGMQMGIDMVECYRSNDPWGMLQARPFLDAMAYPRQEHDAGDTTKTNILASSRRVHDMLYRTLGVPPPPSWKKRLGSASTSGVLGGRPDPSESGSRRRASKRAELGPTDTNSLQEMLACSGPHGPHEVCGAIRRTMNCCFSVVNWRSSIVPHFLHTRLNPLACSSPDFVTPP